MNIIEMCQKKEIVDFDNKWYIYIFIHVSIFEDESQQI